VIRDSLFTGGVLDYCRILATQNPALAADKARELALGVVAVIDGTRQINMLFDLKRWTYKDPAHGHGASTDLLARLNLGLLRGSLRNPPPRDFQEALDFAQSSLRLTVPLIFSSPWCDPPNIIPLNGG
jgi:hypothetical protein